MGLKLKEYQLVNVLEENKKRIAGNQDSLFSAREVDSGYGIADLVLCNLDEEIINQRLKRKLNIPIFSANTLRTIVALQEANEPISISYLTKQLGISEQTLRSKIIKFLSENGYIEQYEDKYQLLNSYDVVLSKSIGIEAKISDWKRGLYQAHRYKWFCNVSYLALYYKHITPAQNNINLFKQLNIGLISVYDDQVEIIYKPFSETPKSKNMVMLTNELMFDHYLSKKTFSQEFKKSS